ncbi:MAG: hypothetical protein ACM3XM_21035 [Mycobacterium leprae]
MPRWARFLSCAFTGLLLTLLGFLGVAGWWEGRSGYWQSVVSFLSTPAFWSLVLLFSLLVGAGLLLARLGVYLYGAPNLLAGLLAGILPALVYVVFLLAANGRQWGGLGASLLKAWPSALLFVLPFACAGAFTTWLWDRLD